MDAGEDQEVLLQRASASYLAELQKSLPRFLFPGNSSSSRKIHRTVRAATTTHVVNLLEHFQEWPQLLDPHLQQVVGLLSEALLRASQEQRQEPRSVSTNHGVVEPLSQAVCRLLYTLCKVRGPKVVSRLLNNEAEILEPILEDLEDMVSQQESSGDQDAGEDATWEEKYVHMLWLSHLLFAPFDLSTIGSSNPAGLQPPHGLKLPDQLPPIVTRLTAIAAEHISSPGKERDAAVRLLSRLAARPDMLRLKVHASLIEWSLDLLQRASVAESAKPYESIGILNLLGALSNAIGPNALEPFLLTIFRNIIKLANIDDSNSITNKSAVARKAVIKLLRVLTISALQISETSTNLADYVLDDVMDRLLNSLADNDTPVRQASSKAISVIASRLTPEMGAEIVEAIVGSLEENVLWIQADSGRSASHPSKKDTSLPMRRDLSAVDPLRWHGLVLTLSQLLFQRSAPSSQLHTVLNVLLLALQFEKRAASGTSIGTNVRDAANFGIWSIARKYSTKELLDVKPPLTESHLGTRHPSVSSTIQSIANELIVAACLDHSGNIRRGSSAALQELIGRHPDAIKEGINIVQTVDYHAVALRSRAMSGVALVAAKLHHVYWERLIDAIFGWRGLRASDPSTRRLAAKTVGRLANVYGNDEFTQMARSVLDQITSLRRRDVEARHGLFLAAASLVHTEFKDESSRKSLSDLWGLLTPGRVFEEHDLVVSTKRPEQTSEAVSEVMRSFFFASSPTVDSMLPPSIDIINACDRYLDLALQRREEVVISSASNAASEVFNSSQLEKKMMMIDKWAKFVAFDHTGGSTASCHGYLTALSKVYSPDNSQSDLLNQRVKAALFNVLRKSSHAEVEMKVVALRGLSESVIAKIRTLDVELIELLALSLQDYTVDQRGDVGSLVRLEAITAVDKAASRGMIDAIPMHIDLASLVATLAGEKLDKVRFAAWNCLRACRKLFGQDDLAASTFDTIGQTSGLLYYQELIRLLSVERLRRPVLKGLVISTGAGSESVLRASRLALAQHYEKQDDQQIMALEVMMLSLLQDNLDHERLVVPLLETWTYLLQSQLLLRSNGAMPQPDFSFRKLFVVVQKAHFKSGNVQKLTAAIEVYNGLAEIGDFKDDVLQKLASMVFHPLPRVRDTAADALYRLTKQPQMLSIDWSKPPKELKKKWSGI